MVANLSDKLVRELPTPPRGNRITYDERVKGFGVRVTKAGARSFILTYWRKRDGVQKRWTIGSFPDWSTGAARDEAKRLKRLIDGGADPVGEHRGKRTAPTIAAACDRFIAEYLPRKRPSTAKSYRQIIEANIRPALGRMKVANVTYGDVDDLHRSMSKRGAPGAANRTAAVLSRLFSLAIRWHWRTDNPCKGIERNDEIKRRRYLTADEILRLSAALSLHRDQQAATIIRLLLLTGARRGEVLAARWDDFDFAVGTWNKPASSTKQKTAHSIPLGAAAMQLLTEQRGRSETDAEWVFPGRDSTHRKDIKDSWATVCKAAGITGVRAHDLRHTFASVLASAGLSLPVIGALLGHATPVTTARYAHLFDDPLRQATERAGAIISGKASAELIALKGSR